MNLLITKMGDQFVTADTVSSMILPVSYPLLIYLQLFENKNCFVSYELSVYLQLFKIKNCFASSPLLIYLLLNKNKNCFVYFLLLIFFTDK